MRILCWIMVLELSNCLASDTLFTHPHYPPLIYTGSEYNFYKYTPRYVPNDMLHCFKILGTCDDETLERFKLRSREEVIERGIFDRGYRLRKEFCLEGYSSFTHYFHKHGIYYPYAMQTYILLCFHQYLNQQRISWSENKRDALHERHTENRAWRKRAKQLFKPVKEDPVVLESEPEETFEDQFFNW